MKAFCKDFWIFPVPAVNCFKANSRRIGAVALISCFVKCFFFQLTPSAWWMYTVLIVKA